MYKRRILQVGLIALFLASCNLISLQEYTISFDSNGGSIVASQTILEGSRLVIPNSPVKEGYSFDGWYLDEDCTAAWSFYSKVYSNLVLYAKWKSIDYLINYFLDGGMNYGGNPTGYKASSGVESFSDPQKENYTFEGWFSDSAYETQVTSIPVGTTGNINLYAKWRPVSYNITYNLNGGTNDVSNPISYAYETGEIELKGPTRSGYVFRGWFADEFFYEKVNKVNKGTTGDISLYAKWLEYTPKSKFTYQQINTNEIEIIGLIEPITESEIAIPQQIDGLNVTTIGDSAFESVEYLEYVFLPPTLNSIGVQSFAGCKNIEEIDFPNSLETIKAGAFAYCSSLLEVVIPETVLTMGDYVFGLCSKIHVIRCEAESKPDGWSDLWNQYNNAPVVWGY